MWNMTSLLLQYCKYTTTTQHTTYRHSGNKKYNSTKRINTLLLSHYIILQYINIILVLVT